MGTKERKWTEAIGIKGDFKTSPGPGNYTVKSTIGGGPACVIRPKTAAPKPDGLPGPGQYTSDLDKPLGKIPSVVIGNEERKNPMLNGNKTNPGPGQYNVYSTLDSRRSYTYFIYHYYVLGLAKNCLQIRRLMLQVPELMKFKSFNG